MFIFTCKINKNCTPKIITYHFVFFFDTFILGFFNEKWFRALGKMEIKCKKFKSKFKKKKQFKNFQILNEFEWLKSPWKNDSLMENPWTVTRTQTVTWTEIIFELNLNLNSNQNNSKTRNRKLKKSELWALAFIVHITWQKLQKS